MGEQEDTSLTKQQRRRGKVKTATFTVGGLHMDDFALASRQYEETGYVLIGFVMDVDGYHWKAVYVKAEELEKALEVNIFGA
jgi:hypothetical protein